MATLDGALYRSPCPCCGDSPWQVAQPNSQSPGALTDHAGLCNAAQRQRNASTVFLCPATLCHHFTASTRYKVQSTSTASARGYPPRVPNRNGGKYPLLWAIPWTYPKCLTLWDFSLTRNDQDSWLVLLLLLSFSSPQPPKDQKDELLFSFFQLSRV